MLVQSIDLLVCHILYFIKNELKACFVPYVVISIYSNQHMDMSCLISMVPASECTKYILSIDFIAESCFFY